MQLGWNFVGVNCINFVGNIVGVDDLAFPIMFSHIFWFVFGFYFLENGKVIINSINIKLGIVLIFFLNFWMLEPFYFSLPKMFNSIVPFFQYISIIINPVFCLLELLVFYKISAIFVNERSIISNVIKNTGDNSLEIYLIHPFIIIILGRVLFSVGLNFEKLLFYPIMLVGVGYGSYLFALIYRMLKVRFKKEIIS